MPSNNIALNNHKIRWFTLHHSAIPSIRDVKPALLEAETSNRPGVWPWKEPQVAKPEFLNRPICFYQILYMFEGLATLHLHLIPIYPVISVKMYIEKDWKGLISANLGDFYII